MPHPIRVLRLPPYILFEHRKGFVVQSKLQNYANHFKDGLYFNRNTNHSFYILNGVQYDYSIDDFKERLKNFNYKERRMPKQIYNALSVLFANDMLNQSQKELYLKEYNLIKGREYKLDGYKVRKSLGLKR